ncbi:4-(cytidine 5'-diphospho)-2-C-methyl-D-erythritol kinase [Peptoniphilus sp. KCTC 25270]|uniref:4-(cytidine 5'-diphospho)-2-C-methyl-D-erythritol kinase n=1 Tax=Peptoniphilus sp. KCTC 25270 TaxID=2897414 RepID=UPI001E38C15B|nr:4-(cytidine 5'-diphospho)-2-C-methyl-D-erythritol kinase [Peptoniphilus sp. KCTC 25270]MCD1146765.1 4-(cytidine 5'-diphospho)-2-C-methyl-D-erythritol kinase [Peptoniphilus sp. KCTC 25270]
MELKAYGKINLGLKILGKREDGYHKVETLLLPIQLADNLSFEPNPVFEIQGPNFGSDDFMYKSIRALEKKVGSPLGGKIAIQKKIPVGAGLAGGTADGAASIKGFNELHNLNYTIEELTEMVASLGADFTYCMYNHSAFGTGIGENLEFLYGIPSIPCILLNPGFSVSTKEAYSWICEYSDGLDREKIVEALRNMDGKQLQDFAENDLEFGVAKRFPEIDAMKRNLYDSGAEFASMTGSGPTVFGLYSSIEAREKAFEELKDKWAIAIQTSIWEGDWNE